MSLLLVRLFVVLLESKSVRSETFGCLEGQIFGREDPQQ